LLLSSSLFAKMRPDLQTAWITSMRVSVAMTTTKKELYDVLLKLRTSLQDKLEQLESGESLDTTGTGYTNHQADDATMVYDQTVSVSTLKATRNRLRQVKEALIRYEAGTYGICENCEREIDIARLEAIPYTSLCMHCAEIRDYQAGM
jgi:RNA polymerase-binding transcription factor DksA